MKELVVFFRFFKLEIMLFWVLSANFGSVLAETVVGSLTTTVITENIAPSCDIHVPHEIYLGTLENGTRKHSPFELSVTCKDNTKTAFVASIVKGKLSGADAVTMSNGSLLRLENENSNIKLQGKNTDSFCLGQSSGIRTCELTPVTEVDANNQRGKAEATLNFKIIYPA